MALFTYQGRTQQGQSVDGQIEADDQSAAASLLVDKHITPVSIKLIKQSNNSLLDIDVMELFSGGRVKLEELIFLCRQLHALSQAGVPIVKALSRIADTTRSLVMQKALRGVVDKLLAGQSLARAFSTFPKIFPPLFINLVGVGEESGKLEEIFSQLALYFQLEEKTRARIKTAMRYPLTVIITMIMALIVINFMVVPTFANLFKQYKLPPPWPTQVLIDCSNFMIANWPWLALGAMLLTIGFFVYRNTPNGRYRVDQFKLKIPVIGHILKRIILSRFSRTFAMMSEAGVPVLQSVKLIASVLNNEYMAKQVLTIHTAIERGESFYSAATASQLFSPLVLQMLSVGEESGNVDDMLKQTAEFYDGEVDYDIARLSDLIQPFMVICLGILVLVLALGVLLPMWDMVKLARH